MMDSIKCIVMVKKMLNYILKTLVIFVAIVTVVISSSFIIKARSSRLYMAVFRFSLFGATVSILSLFLNGKFSDIIYFILNVNLIAFWMSLYNLWFVKYNQISNKAYNTVILLAAILSLALDYLVFNGKIVLLPILISISKFHIISILMIFFCIVKFYQFRKQNTNTALNKIPFLFLISLLSSMTAMVVEHNLSLIFTLISSLSQLLVTSLYYKDFKRSFYY